MSETNYWALLSKTERYFFDAEEYRGAWLLKLRSADLFTSDAGYRRRVVNLSAAHRALNSGDDENWEHLGFVGVDSGRVVIGDPCRALTLEPVPLPDGETPDGLSVVCRSGYGDGAYPVEVRRLPFADLGLPEGSPGRVAELRVTFIEHDPIDDTKRRLAAVREPHERAEAIKHECERILCTTEELAELLADHEAELN